MLEAGVGADDGADVEAAFSANRGADPLAWLAPGQRGGAAESLARIRSICAHVPDLYTAKLAVLATHAELPRKVLATAIKQFRPDTEALSAEDVAGLLTASWNGGRQGFDAVLRTRRDGSGNRSKPALPAWASRD